MNIYTVGYSGIKVTDLKRAVEELDALIMDIRYSPMSRIPMWRRENLTATFGERYVHVRALGNVNYKGGPISIVDYVAGRRAIENSNRTVILMCVCGHYATCHRAVVASLLRSDGFEVEELNVKRVIPESPLAVIEVGQLNLF